jgi:hypothetical protein
MNQHSCSEVQGDLLQNLKRSIEVPGKLLLLLDSWRDPAPLARCWCLFELYTAIRSDADIVMAMSRSEEHSFTGDLEANRGELEQLIQLLDAEQAEATVEADKEIIFSRIRSEIGFEAFNETLSDTLRSSLQRAVMATRNPFQSGKKALSAER